MNYRLKPYMEDPELKYLEDLVKSLPDGAKIMEWGSGGSTTMFLELINSTQRLISVEHDVAWAEKVYLSVADHPNRDCFMPINVQLQSITFTNQEGKDDSTLYELYKQKMIGTFLEENPSFLKNYIDPTKLTVDEAARRWLDMIFDADVYFVDGLARGAVLATIKLKAKKKDAVVMIHDYVGRQNQYDWAASLYSKGEIIPPTLLKLTI